jgi:hypothetical protein
VGKKKVPTVDDCVKNFRDVMERASLSPYNHVNGIVLNKNLNNHRILLVPDKLLWDRLVDDIRIKIKEFDLFNVDEKSESQWAIFGEDLVNSWIPIEVKEDLYNGKLFKIKIKDYEYKISVNRDFMPMKLKKAEYDNVSYRVFYQNNKLVLGIKKRFDAVIPDYGFTMMRLFEVI